MKVFFTFPFLLIYVLLLLGFCWRQGWQRLAKGVLVFTIIMLYLLCTSLMTRVLLKAVGDYPPIGHPEVLQSEGVQAIVVLGGGYYQSPETGPEPVAGLYSLSRVRYASIMARLTGLPVLMTGIEGDAMARTFVQDYGIQAKWVEGKSQTTAENAEFTARILLPLNVRRIALVTDAWHMERGRFAFEQQGFIVRCAPTNLPLGFAPEGAGWMVPRMEYLLSNLFGLSELLGQAKYRFSAMISTKAPSPAPSPATAPETKTRP